MEVTHCRCQICGFEWIDQAGLTFCPMCRLKAWEPLVKDALRRAESPDGTKDVDDHFIMALEIPKEHRP